MPNINEFLHTTLGSDEETATGEGLPSEIKCLFFCATDTRKELSWSMIDGVRRISEIRYFSDSVNLLYGINIYFKRVFTYGSSFPRDLIEIKDLMLSI